jgi:RNA polymerase sigma factor (sigma-70 family)
VNEVAGQEENELYAKWLETAPANRGDVEAKLFAAIKRHGQAVLCKKLGEAPPDLVQAVVAAVMTQIRKFRGECKFSTWVQGIAHRKAKEYIRGKVRERRVFDEYVAVVESDLEDALEPRVGEITPSVLPQLDGDIAVRELFQSLSKEDGTLLRYKEEGRTSKEIAEAIGTTVEAVDSRWARLKPRVKNFRSTRRKQGTPGN